MLGTTSTAYDLRFRILGIPARVHPLFWLTAALLGGITRDPIDFPLVLTWMGCLFVSILIHEYGHALMDRRFHGEPSVLLYGLGGLCYPSGHESPVQKLAVLLAGPGAGFIFCGLVFGITSLVFGISGSEHAAVALASMGLSPNPMAFQSGLAKLHTETGIQIYWNLVRINLMWGLVNLLPIYPLDGGQSAQVVWTFLDRRDGVRRSHILALVTAGILGVFFFVRDPNDYFLPLFFGVLALLNYQVLHSLHQAHVYGQHENDDWWRG